MSYPGSIFRSGSSQGCGPGLAGPGAEAKRRHPGRAGRGQQAHLRIRSCGVAPCRPCLPSGLLSLDPSETEKEAECVVAKWATALWATLTGSQAQLPHVLTSGSFHGGGGGCSLTHARQNSGHLGCFYFLAIMNNASEHLCTTTVGTWAFLSLGQIPRTTQ